MRRETLAEKSARLVQPSFGNEAPPVMPQRPTLLQSQSFLSPDVREAVMEREREASKAARSRVLEQHEQYEDSPDEENPEDVFDRLQSLAKNGGEESPKEETARAKKNESVEEISSYDKDILEMVDSIDVGELILRGRVAHELTIIEDLFTISVQSLRKADLIEVQSDVDLYQRGYPDPDKESARVYPSSAAVNDYEELRHLSQGILGMNTKALPADSSARMEILSQLATPIYRVVAREYSKFLRAVNLLFPDEPTKKQMDKLRNTLKKVEAHR